MLLELTVKHLAVIDEVRVRFQNGFHVLTGETGAGKSILIDALSLSIGGRASSDLVRHGHDRAEIEALFDVAADHPVWGVLEEHGIDGTADEPLIVRRDIAVSGKSTARVNGQSVTLATLRAIGETLVNIHGQHEHQSLLRTERHLDWLDAYGGTAVGAVKQSYQGVYREFVRVRNELETLKAGGQQALQLADLYRFQSDEIAQADLKLGEDEWLQEEKQRLSNAERLFDATSRAYELLYGPGQAVEAVGKALQRIQEIVRWDESKLSPIVEQLQSSYYQIEDASFQLRDYREDVEFNSERLEEIETRLQTISGLKRKYGDSIERIIAHGEQMERELNGLDHQEERIVAFEQELHRLTQQLHEQAGRLSDVRRQAAAALSSELMRHLKDLHMEKTIFDVELRTEKDRVTKDGWDAAEFLIAPNPGEPLRSLSKIASGGELSRIMLALKSIFSSLDRVPVLIFDEVDTGVSGRAAQAIAEKLAQLARQAQVFAITHLPQVACMADAHYAIVKKVEDNRTFTVVTSLGEKERAEELARMLGGVEVTGTTLQHAEEMLALARSRKETWG